MSTEIIHTQKVATEEWRSVFGYEGIYEISTLGRLKCRGELRAPTVEGHGYYIVTLRKMERRSILICIVASAFILNPLGKPQVNHIDGVKTNNRVTNLEWATSKENIRHAWKNGLSKATRLGPQQKLAKLTPEKVIEMPLGEKNVILAIDYGISPHTVSQIVCGKAWKYIL